MKKRIAFLPYVMILASLLLLGGCPKKADVTGTGGEQQAAPAAKEEPRQDMNIEPAKEAAAAAPAGEEVKERAAAEAGLQTIYFDFDKSFVRSDMLAVMKANAEWLKAHAKASIRIEGNCDERGTREYNQALGQRRAAAAKKYLTDLGVSAKRISLISYGKEKQVCTASTEECWQKNRRDDFVVVTK